jgi:hypothetical protein
VETLRTKYRRTTDGAVDLVTYWFAKAWEQIELGKSDRCGLVATQSIRRGSSQSVLKRIVTGGCIFNAWSDEPWIIDGAAVRVCLVCFAEERPIVPQLDGVAVQRVFGDLSAGLDLGLAKTLSTNKGACFQGPVKVGPFDIDGKLAREWLAAPLNPNCRSNSDVLRPWINGNDVTRRPSDKWIIDFAERCAAVAALYELPYEYVRVHVKPLRDLNRRERRRKNWWQHGETVPGLRAVIHGLSRVIITPRVAKHRLFCWAHVSTLPDTRLVIIDPMIRLTVYCTLDLTNCGRSDWEDGTA